MDTSLFTLGFILGLRHALDADHLLAVSTLVSEKKTVMGSSVVGAFWGIGHTLSLLTVGLIVLALELTIPERVATGVELCVGFMLVIMGINVLRKLGRGGTLHIHPHQHGSLVHSHPHIHELRHFESNERSGHHALPLESFSHGIWSLIHTGKASMVVGILHGFAGSAGLMLLVAATIPSFWVGVFYVLAFGIGSIGGMILMSTLLSIPFVLTAPRFQQIRFAVRMFSGIASVGFGLFLSWETGRTLLQLS